MKKMFAVLIVLTLLFTGCEYQLMITKVPDKTPLSITLDFTISPSATVTIESTLSPTPEPTPTPIPYTIEEKTAARGIMALLKVLKNPDSLKIHRIVYWYEVEEPKDLHVEIDMSAENGFGGMDRTIYSIMISNKYESLGWRDNTYNVTIHESSARSSSLDVWSEIDIDRVMEIVEGDS
jgi:hypothetical protein